MRMWLLALLVMMAPTVGWAGTASKGCGFSGTTAGVAGTAVGSATTSMTISGLDRWCYRYVAADGVHNLGYLHINASSTAVWFDTDLFQTAATTARVTVHFCPAGAAVDTSNPLRSCPSIGELSGVEGEAGVQDQIVRVGPGMLLFEFNAACEAGDTCQVMAQSEDPEGP